MRALPRVPITVMGYRCERCKHEWIPRDLVREPTICPKCKSPYWDRPKESKMAYEDFRDNVKDTLKASDQPLTWTEVRTAAGLPQKYPNNQWVRRMERDIGLERKRDKQGIIQWALAG